MKDFKTIFKLFISRLLGKVLTSLTLFISVISLNAQHLAPEDIKASNIIWVGEMHGTTKSYEFTFDIIKEVNETEGLQYILLELGFMDEIRKNQYLETGSETLLDSIMTGYKTAPIYSHEYRSYLKKIYNYNKEQPIDQRIKFISIDIEHGFLGAEKYIVQHTDKAAIQDSSMLVSKLFLSLKDRLKLEKRTSNLEALKRLYNFYTSLYTDISENDSVYQVLWGSNFDQFKYLVRNCMYATYAYANDTSRDNWSKVRDSLIYENFKWRNKEVDFTKNRMVAKWGQQHTLQSKQKKDDVEYIATRMKRKNPEIKQLTLFTTYLKCGFLVPNHEIPGIIRWTFKKDGKDHRIVKSIINNNGLFFRVNGVKYLKKIATKDVQVFDISKLPDDKNYVLGRDKKLSNLDYAQYVVLIQNSKASKTLEE